MAAPATRVSLDGAVLYRGQSMERYDIIRTFFGIHFHSSSDSSTMFQLFQPKTAAGLLFSVLLSGACGWVDGWMDRLQAAPRTTDERTNEPR